MIKVECVVVKFYFDPGPGGSSGSVRESPTSAGYRIKEQHRYSLSDLGDGKIT